MNCYKCGSNRRSFHSIRKRKIKTLQGIIERETFVYKCYDCGQFFCTEVEEAPFHGVWGWDVIEELGKVLRKGFSYDEVTLYFLRNFRLKLSSSTISDLKSRYRIERMINV